MNLQEKLELHKLWLNGKGKKFNLKDDDLQGADLQDADLQDANLQGANLDFSSGIPFHCGGTKFKGDDRLFAQMLFHITHAEWELNDEYKAILNTLTKLGAHKFFSKFR